jgi:hypothetical protein
MRVSPTRGGRLALLAVLAASGSAVSCGGATDTSDEPHASEMRLLIGGKQVTVTRTGAVIGETIVLRVGVPTTVAAVFTDDFEVPDPKVVPGDFRLDAEVLSANIATYTASSTNSLGGTLTALHASPGTYLRFSLYHVGKRHIDWGPFNVTVVTVN